MRHRMPKNKSNFMLMLFSLEERKKWCGGQIRGKDTHLLRIFSSLSLFAVACACLLCLLVLLMCFVVMAITIVLVAVTLRSRDVFPVCPKQLINSV